MVTELEQTARRFRIVENIKRQAIRFRVPESQPPVSLTSQPLRPDIETGIIPVVSLVQLKNTKADSLLILWIAFDSDVRFGPHLGPVSTLFGRYRIVSRLRMPSREFDPSLPEVVATGRRVFLRHVDDQFVQHAALSLLQAQDQFTTDVVFLLYQLVAHGVRCIYAKTGKQSVPRVHRLPQDP
ncbi:hypothetical protein D3C74_312850 [compost metagenome]